MRHEKRFFHRLQRWPFADVDMATPPAAQLTVAALPTPKTLESTLQLSSDVDEIPCYPQIAESAHGDIVAVWEQFDGGRGQGRAGRFDTTASHRRGEYLLLI